MCLSVPGKVISINNEVAEVSIGGAIVKASILLVDNLKVGDYVLVHTGYIIQIIDEEQATETLKIIQDMQND